MNVGKRHWSRCRRGRGLLRWNRRNGNLRQLLAVPRAVGSFGRDLPPTPGGGEGFPASCGSLVVTGRQPRLRLIGDCQSLWADWLARTMLLFGGRSLALGIRVPPLSSGTASIQIGSAIRKKDFHSQPSWLRSPSGSSEKGQDAAFSTPAQFGSTNTEEGRAMVPYTPIAMASVSEFRTRRSWMSRRLCKGRSSPT